MVQITCRAFALTKPQERRYGLQVEDPEFLIGDAVYGWAQSIFLILSAVLVNVNGSFWHLEF